MLLVNAHQNLHQLRHGSTERLNITAGPGDQETRSKISLTLAGLAQSKFSSTFQRLAFNFSGKDRRSHSTAGKHYLFHTLASGFVVFG